MVPEPAKKSRTVTGLFGNDTNFNNSLIKLVGFGEVNTLFPPKIFCSSFDPCVAVPYFSASSHEFAIEP